MKRWMKWGIALLVVLVLAGAALRTLKARKTARESAELASSSKAPAALELASTDVATVRALSLTRTLPVSGGLKAVNSAVVKARVAGEIKSLTVREGSVVKAGQVIGQIDATELALRVRQAEQTAATSRAQRDIAKRTLDNNRALMAQGFISATGLETSISNEAAAQATYGAAQAAVDLARKSLADAQLVAPLSGTVSQRLVQPGERAGIDARLVEIVDLSRIELEAAMTPEDVFAVQVGQTARLQVDGLSTPVEAKVTRISPSTQAGTRAVLVFLSLAPQPGLRQGLFAKGAIELQQRTALVAPLSTVRVDQPRPYVLALEGGLTQERPVTLGQRGEAVIDGVRESVIEITEGVAAQAVLLRGTVGSVRAGTPARLAAAASAAITAPAPAQATTQAVAPAAASTPRTR